MRAKDIRYTVGGGAEVVEVEVGKPGAGEVQVKLAACGICSWDLQTFRAGADDKFAAPPGHEGLGYITEVGDGVQGFDVGDRVVGGGFAEVRNSKARRLYKIPDADLPDHELIVEPVSCVVTGMDHCQLKAGERLAMVGCGFMGLMMIQGLAGSAADQLIALDVDDARLALAADMGASETHNVAGADFADVVRDLKRRGIDVVVDTTGAQPGLDLATDIVRPGGRINLFGWIKGQQASFDPSAWHSKGITIVNSSPASRLRDPFPAAIRLLLNKTIRLDRLVTHTCSIDDYPALMTDVTAGRASGYIKGVVTN